MPKQKTKFQKLIKSNVDYRVYHKGRIAGTQEMLYGLMHIVNAVLRCEYDYGTKRLIDFNEKVFQYLDDYQTGTYFALEDITTILKEECDFDLPEYLKNKLKDYIDESR